MAEEERKRVSGERKEKRRQSCAQQRERKGRVIERGKRDWEKGWLKNRGRKGENLGESFE